MDDSWAHPDEAVVEEARVLIKAGCFLGRDPDIDMDDDPFTELVNLVLHQGTPSPELFAVLDDLCAILPHRPDVLPIFFGGLVSVVESSLGHARWTHPLIDDYRTVDVLDRLIHHHLVRRAPVFRTYLHADHPEDRVGAASVAAYAGREYPDVFPEYWDAATTMSSPDADDRLTFFSGLKCFPPQPDYFDTLAAFVRDQAFDPWSVFAVECALFHWGAYAGEDVQTRQALGRLDAAKAAVIARHPVYARSMNSDAQVARGRALTDPMERWAGWASFLPEALLDGMTLGKIAFDLMGDPEGAGVLTEAFLDALDTLPNDRDYPSRTWLAEILQHHGMTLPDRTGPVVH